MDLLLRRALLLVFTGGCWYTLFALVEFENGLGDEALVGERNERLSACVE